MLLVNKTLLKLSNGVRHWIFILTGLKIVVLVGTAAFAGTVSRFLSSVSDPRMSQSDLSSAVVSALIAALVILAGEILIGEAEYRCTAKARLSLRELIFTKILLLDVGKIEKLGSTNAIAAAVDGIESMQTYYSRYLPALLYSAVAPFYLFFRLKDASLPVAIFLLTVSLAIFPVNNLFRKVLSNLKDNYWGSFRDLTGYYLESLQSLVTLKIFNIDEKRSQKVREKADKFNDNIMDVMKINFRATIITDIIIYTAVAGTVTIAANQVQLGQVSLADGLLIFMLGYSFFSSSKQLMGAAHSALSGIAAAQNVADILELDISRPVLAYSQKEETDGFQGIRLHDVGYSYDERKAVLRKVNIDIEKDKVTALIGRSGSGKSTVSGLLMRFFDPQEGTITTEGVDYRCLDPDELRKRVIMVPQFVAIFSGSVADNLRIAAPDATDEQLMEVLKMVRLDKWISSQPNGLNTSVGDAGAKLSGGQRQKIGIARVLLCDAPYIIFDEATSSVDVESEAEIWACIADLAKSRTLIIISHRMSTIKDADRIYVLDKGEVSEHGSHTNLMAQRGIYAGLVYEQQKLENHGLVEVATS